MFRHLSTNSDVIYAFSETFYKIYQLTLAEIRTIGIRSVRSSVYTCSIILNLTDIDECHILSLEVLNERSRGDNFSHKILLQLQRILSKLPI